MTIFMVNVLVWLVFFLYFCQALSVISLCAISLAKEEECNESATFIARLTSDKYDRTKRYQ